MTWRRSVLGLAIASSLGAAACTSGAPSLGYVPPVKPEGPSLVYVAVGASETVGFGSDDPLVEAWPQVLYRSALPVAASFINVGVPGATAADALAVQVPQALALHPDLVTVWLNVNDIIAGVAPAAYGRELLRLLEALRDQGATRVLVANTPPIEDLPAYRACLPYLPTGSGCDTGRKAPTPGQLARIIAAYNRAIWSDAAQTGAQVVDLHAVTVAAEKNHTFGSLVSRDGFHPDDAGHRAVAVAFARAYRSP